MSMWLILFCVFWIFIFQIRSLEKMVMSFMDNVCFIGSLLIKWTLIWANLLSELIVFRSYHSCLVVNLTNPVLMFKNNDLWIVQTVLYIDYSFKWTGKITKTLDLARAAYPCRESTAYPKSVTSFTHIQHSTLTNAHKSL